MKYEACFLVLCFNYVHDYLQSPKASAINLKFMFAGNLKTPLSFLIHSSIDKQQELGHASDIQHLGFYQLCIKQHCKYLLDIKLLNCKLF